MQDRARIHRKLQGREKMPAYSDDDITFFMGLYRDRVRAEGALSRLRANFPTARVIVRSDGDKDPQNKELSERFEVEYWAEERLFPIENGGALIARMLELYLDYSTRFVFKIDTDTAVHRRFRFLPEQSGVFGTLQKSKQGCMSIQGGFTGFTEDAARTILDSGMLGDRRLKNPFQCKEESLYFSSMAKRAERCGLSSFDWIVGWVATELDIPMFNFPDVRCRWHVDEDFTNENLKFAAAHPVYF